MSKCFKVECRYEYRSHEGKKWTNWFAIGGCRETEAEAKELIRYNKKQFGDIDRYTKLTHEYRVVET